MMYFLAIRATSLVTVRALQRDHRYCIPGLCTSRMEGYWSNDVNEGALRLGMVVGADFQYVLPHIIGVFSSVQHGHRPFIW